MLSIAPTLVYENLYWVAEVDPARDVEQEFLRAVEARIGRGRFALTSVAREDVQVGQSGLFFIEKRSQQAVVAKYEMSKMWINAAFLATKFGSYATFGVYLHGPAGYAREKMKSFDELVSFNSFNAVCDLVLQHVVHYDLELADASKAPRIGHSLQNWKA